VILRLKNELRVVILERPGWSVVNSSLVTIGGGSEDPSDRPGLQALLYQALASPEAQVRRRFFDLGAQLLNQVDPDRATLSVRGHPSDVASLIGLLAEVSLRPEFSKEHIRDLVLGRSSALLEAQTIPQLALEIELPKVLYVRDSPFARSVLGTPRSLRQIDSELLKAEHRRTLSPERSLLLVAGDVRVAQVEPFIRQFFGSWSPGRSRLGPVAVPVVQGGTHIVAREGRPQSRIVVARALADLSEAESAALEMLSEALGKGLGSTLNILARHDRGYSYGASTKVLQVGHTEVFRAELEVQREDTELALKDLVSAFAQVPTGITSARPTTPATTAHEIQSITDAFVRGGDLRVGRTYVTDQAALDRIAACLAPQELQWVILGDPERARAALLGAGLSAPGP
jgi:predicted Zn-dependent peptidase